jgi:Fe-S-cluster-containing dehydrogenase component
MKRREFLKLAGITSGGLLLPGFAKANEVNGRKEFKGILIDTTRCIGCRSCELACAEEHNLPEPDIDDESVYEKERKTSETQWTVVNRYTTSKGVFFRKTQCMHCNMPACASACLVKAMFKTEEGPVIWRGDRCMGCRFCMISCPFDIPKFEYNSPNPRIQKCIMCWELLEKGENPACVDACPQSALMFGKRRDLIEIARQRIYAEPDKYVHYIYGEHEVGGTGVLYLSAVPFEELGLRTDLGTTPYPEYSKGFLYGVPVVLLLWPAFLLGVSYIRKEGEKK